MQWSEGTKAAFNRSFACYVHAKHGYPRKYRFTFTLCVMIIIELNCVAFLTSKGEYSGHISLFMPILGICTKSYFCLIFAAFFGVVSAIFIVK